MPTASPSIRTTTALAAVLALLSLAGPAAAQDPRAEALFREGRDAMTRGETDAACAKFEESLSLEQSVGPLLNLAECNERRGQLVRALELWREGLQKLDADDARRELATRRLADLERRVPTIVIQGAAAEDRVFVDGRPAEAGEPTRVDPGPHTVTITAASGATRTLSVEANEGRSTPVEVGADAAASPTPPPATEDDGGSVVPAIVAFSVGGAGLVAFGVTGAMWLGEKSTVDEECPGRVCSQEGLDAGDSGQTLGIVNAVALGVGVVGVGLGGFLLWNASSNDGGAEAAITLTGTGARLDGSF